MIRAHLALALLFGALPVACSRPTKSPADAGAASPKVATSPVPADAGAAQGVSRGWQPFEGKFEPDNSDAQAHVLRMAKELADAGEPEMVVQLVAGGATQTLDTQTLAKLGMSQGDVRPLHEVLATSFPDHRWTIARFVFSDGRSADTKREVLQARAKDFVLKLNRKGQVRVQTPEETSPARGETGSGRGPTAVVDLIELIP